MKFKAHRDHQDRVARANSSRFGAESFRCSSCLDVQDRAGHRHASARPNRRRPPYFLCTACFETPSASAICVHVVPDTRARGLADP